MAHGVLCPKCGAVADVEERECPKCGTALSLLMEKTQIRRADSVQPPAPELSPGPINVSLSSTLDDEAAAVPTSQLKILSGPRDLSATLLGDQGEWEGDGETGADLPPPGRSDRTVSVPVPSADPIGETTNPTLMAPIPLDTQPGAFNHLMRTVPLTGQPLGAGGKPPLPPPKRVITGSAVAPPGVRRPAAPGQPPSSPRGPGQVRKVTLEETEIAGPRLLAPLEATEPVGRSGSPAPHRGDALTGLKLGEYEVQERVGIGGMSTVYRARQQKIGKDVAVKVLRTDVVADARDMEQLLHEARVVNAIHHPGIINIFDAGELPDGRQYLVMEFLDGESLEQRLERESRIPLGEAIPIVEDVLSALAAAHQAGVVHRDIKPANVFLIRQPDGKPWVKLVDFGLARPSERREVSRVAGTPDYISPEHARGKPPGPAADIYSLGVLTFVLATGKLPFTGATAHEVMEKHVKVPAPLASSVDPSTPPALNALVARMLEKDPARRPDAAQVRSELRALGRQLSTRSSDRDVQALSRPTNISGTDSSAITSDSGRTYDVSEAGTSPAMLPLPAHQTSPMPAVEPTPWPQPPKSPPERPATPRLEVKLETSPETISTLPKARLSGSPLPLILVAALAVALLLLALWWAYSPQPSLPPADGKLSAPGMMDPAETVAAPVRRSKGPDPAAAAEPVVIQLSVDGSAAAAADQPAR